MRRTFILLLCLSAMVCFSQSFVPHEVIEEKTKNSKFEQVSLFSLKNNSRSVLPAEIKEYSILEFKRENLKSLLSTNTQNLELTIPSVDRSSLTLQLFEVRFDDAKIKTSSGNYIKTKKGKHFRGVIKGNEHSLVALSFFENDVMGFISDDRNDGNLVIGKMKDNENEIIIYKDQDVLKKLEFNCGTKSGGVNYSEEVLHNHEHSNQRALTDCVRFYYEVDNDIYVEKGSNSTTVTNYVTGLHNQVSALYAAENINVLISEIFIWTTASPYNGQTSQQMLTQFEAQNNGFVGDFGMLLSYKASGGIAYVNTLCFGGSSDFRLGFSSIYNNYANVPTYSWSVNVVTHEFGHLFGSQHTHDCVWNGNNTAIDGCFTPNGCANPGLPPVGSGTIMSYCHTTGVGVNFAMGFGPQPGNVIRNSVTNATCLAACPGNAPTCTDGIQNGAETGVDCGGPVCPPCSTNCTTNPGNLTIIFDDYPSETSWNITNSNGVILYSGSNYSSPNATITVPVCLPNACYTLNFFDSFSDGICCLYGNGSYNLTMNGTSVASGGQFGASISHPFCLTSSATCTDGIQNGNETGIDCGGTCGDPTTTLSGSSSICIGSTTSFTSNYSGTWASSNPSVATISSTGIVTGVSAGNATFTITSTGGCTSTPSVQITVNPNPTVAVTGSNSICIGATSNLSPTTGGTWASNNPSFATVNNAGLVTAVAPGSATFTFTSTAGCVSNPTSPITINPAPVVSLSSSSICIGSAVQATPSSGGTWSSSNSAVASITNTGLITGVAAGNASFTFTDAATGCVSNPTSLLTINPAPVVSLSSSSICIGSNTQATPSAGGTWSSSNSAVATITNTGLITGVAAGNATFTFTNTAAGCVSNPTSPLTINPAPVVSLSSSSICIGSNAQATPSAGGTWSSGNSAVATITNTGLITGVAAGNATFTFTSSSTGCVSSPTSPLTINPAPVVSLSSSSICIGSNAQATPSAGGTWSSSNSAVATITNTGLITGVAAGNATFTFTSSAGCVSSPTNSLTVNSTPIVAITGSNSICVGATSSLSPTTDGTWASSNNSVATVNNAGLVTAVDAGSATFTFTNTSGCVSSPTNSLTVNSTPIVAITGSNSICVGALTSLSPFSGGSWTSSNNTVATVNSAGIVSALAAGSATFTFTSTEGCVSSPTNNITINPIPMVSITGSNTVCVGSTTNLSPVSGGTWVSNNNAIATVTNAGVVSANAAGSASFTFTSTQGCTAQTNSVTITLCATCSDGIQNGDETGVDCGGSCIACPTCSDGIQNGDETGIDCGGSCGNPEIINAIGLTSLCVGSSRPLFSNMSGTWSSTNNSIATIDSFGNKLGVSPGQVRFVLITSGGCSDTSELFTINAIPVVSIPNADSLCLGSITILPIPVPGIWSSENDTISYISNDSLFANMIGTTFVVFKDTTTNCKALVQTTVVSCATCSDGIQNGDETGIDCGGSCSACVTCNDGIQNGDEVGIDCGGSCPACPATCSDGIQNGDETGVDCGGTCGLPILSFNGPSSICINNFIDINTSNSNGTWYSSNPTVATIGQNAQYGDILNAIGVGVSSIYFVTDGGCIVTLGNVTVYSSPIVYVSDDTICRGADYNILSANTGGTWSLPINTYGVTVSNSGVVSAIFNGSSRFLFTDIFGCQTLSDTVVVLGDYPNIPEQICVDVISGATIYDPGSWTVSDSSVILFNNNTDYITLSPGTSIVSFTNALTGCVTTDTIEVLTIPEISIPTHTLCVGEQMTLSYLYQPTFWYSLNTLFYEDTTVASININTGLVTAHAPGLVLFNGYSDYPFCTSITDTVEVFGPVTINTSSLTSLCIGSIGALSPSTGGTWSSSNSAVASITSSGLVSILSEGQVTFTFTSDAGCISTTSEYTIEALPNVSILNGSNICIGTTTNLNPSILGTWVSNSPIVASVDNAGLVTGISAGSSTFTFTNASGCSNTTSVVTVNANPTISAGSTNICLNTLTPLTPNTSSGGSWSTSDPNIVTFSTASGFQALGSGIGIAILTYTHPNGCSSTLTMNVSPNVSVSITGNSNICIGSTTTLSPNTGGTWMSNNPSIATVSNAGIVTAVSAGFTSFTFASNTGCTSNTSDIQVYINPTINATGLSSLCLGYSGQLTANGTGTWTSSDPSIASITVSGDVSGIGLGQVSFTFTNSNGCSSTTNNYNVNPLPTVTITGAISICVGGSTTLSPTSGGTWTTNNPTSSSVTNSGVVSGLAPGESKFTFTDTNGCKNSTPAIPINEVPTVSITGSNNICIGSTTTLSPSTGGTWTSNNASVATITNAGIVTAISAGTATFTFTSSTGCSSNPTNIVTVNSNPVVSLTSTNVCIGNTTTVSPSSGGTWTSSNLSVATVSNAGLVTAITAGTATFTFTNTAGCSSNPTNVLTVNDGSNVTIASTSICVGTTTSVTPSSGGTWTSSNPSVATVTNAGVVTAIATGSATFTFTNTAGCLSSTNALTVISGSNVTIASTSICVGTTTSVTPSSGGTWTSSNPSIATVTNAGIVTAITAGSATFTFTNTAGCISSPTNTLTVKALPVITVSGGNSMCLGTTKNLTPTSGGTWVSSNTAIATVTNAGLVTAIAAGSATFTFTSSTTQCSASTPVITVNPKPTAAISGSNSICVNSTSTVTPATGGTWASSNAAVAIVNNSGLVTGVSAGSATFTFTNTAGCVSNATPTITIKALPVITVSGGNTMCAGTNKNLTPTSGGTWVSSNTSIATVTNAGVITALANSSGNVTFTFTSTTTQCSASTPTITVNPKPTVSVNGGNTMCVGTTKTLNPGSGGTWTSSNNSVATVTNAGVVTGVAAGSATFTFTSSSGCVSNATPVVTVNAKPTVSITGTSSICIGSTTKLSPTTGGTWASSNNSIATVTNAGIVTGVAAGSVTFNFTSTAGCVSNSTPAVTVSACTGLGGYYFETGWEGWSDGGADCARYSGTQSPEGTWSIQIRDNSGSSSAMTSPTYTNGASFQSMKVEFRFRMVGYETGEDFWLQYSSNNGTSWTTVKTWVRGSTYANGTIYNETVTLNKPTWNLSNQARFRFVSDASADDDQVYIDAVIINGYATAQATGNTPQLSANVEENKETIVDSPITYEVYPNPAFNFVNVKLSSFDEDKNIDVKLYGMDGKLAYSTKIDSDLNKLDVSNLKSGVYIMIINEDGKIKTREKVIISN